MSQAAEHYLRATRHPWSCFLFLLPLLAAYEGGMWWLGSAGTDTLRTGADTWLRWLFVTFGLPAMHWPPVLISVILLAWSWLRRHERPKDLLGVWLGMAVESLAFALLLWGLGRIHEPLLDRLQVILAAPGQERDQVASAISFVGAGIYEELLFRLMLFPVLLKIIQFTETTGVVAVALAMGLSALAFALAHHLGPYGEPMDTRVFLFRALAGLYFAILYQFRGFGVTVGAHACYDVLVGSAAA